MDHGALDAGTPNEGGFMQLTKPVPAAVLGCAALLLGHAPAAHAQPANQPNLPPTQAIDAPQVEHLFGDWDGARTRLTQDGINIQFDALTEFMGNVDGGVKQGSTFANQVTFTNDINWERLAGLTGFSTHIIIVNRSGSSDSQLFGDKLLPVQEIYGSGGDVALHLVSAYAQETLMDKALDIAVGRMNVENDFASSALYCSFLNNGLCGDPKALPAGDIGHSAYPDAAWAARIKYRPAPEFIITTGVYEVNQGMYNYANFRSGFKFDASQDSGVYLPVQLGWEPSFGADKMPGHYYVGAGYDTSGGYKDFGNVLAAAGVPGFVKTVRTGNTQVWFLADQMLLRQGSGPSDGLLALGGFTHNDPNNSAYAEQYFIGLIDTGFWAARPKDAAAVLFEHNTISGRLGNVQGVEQALDLAYSNNATGIQTAESFVEANYDVHVWDGVHFQPDVQYIIHPNAQTNISDAWVLGFRAKVSF
jgi:porin